ncbi:MAG: RluA family pseudouridine synthase [Rickettsiales bacterium]|jgi:23S rRNA pseudouridine1911/1915/1917 synthase|nr:RluA family pseudouridine synthase [Rickettsiales bacterium]
MTPSEKIFTVSENDAGKRLDKFIAENLPEFSRNEIQKFHIAKLGTGYQVLGTGNQIKFSDRVKPGDEYLVDVPIRNTDSFGLIPDSSDFDLQIVYEDDDIIAVNKPRGVVMYPAAGNDAGTLVQNILAHTHLSTLGGDIRPGVVHRLDKDTSGVVVLAKSDAAFRGLTKTFAAHDLTRTYIAFVWGIPNWETADITGNIARSARNRQKMTMVRAGGKAAQTQVAVANLWPREKISELRCTLLTGRTHQIRVHLSTHGFPVLCDPVYGRGAARLGSVRDPELLDFLRGCHGQMLHAELLELKHPVTGAPMRFKTRLPQDMQMLKDTLNR